MARPRKQPAGARPSLLTADAASLPEIPVAEQPYPLPAGWKWVRLGDVAHLQAGKNIPSRSIQCQESDNFPFPCFGGNGVRGYVATFNHDGVYPLIGRQGALCGNVHLASGKFYATEHAVAVSGRIQLCPIWVFYCLRDMNLNQYATATAQPGLAVSTLNTLPFPLPSREEQERIVARIESLFARLDEAREKVDAVAESYETRKAALLHKAFNGELTAKWREEKGVDVNGWKRVRLGDVYQINPKITANDDTLVSFVPMEKISPGMTGSFTFEIMPWGKAKKGHTQFADGDVAFAKISPCFENGKSMLVHGLENGIGAGTTELIVLRQPDIIQKYTFYLVSSADFIRKGIQTYSGTVGQQRISMDFVRAYPIPLPTLPEQEEIVRLLDSLLERERQIREAAEQVRERIDLMKRAILARAFRGELG